MSFRMAGLSLILYGIFLIGECVIASLYYDSLQLDLSGVVVLFLGCYVTDRGRRAAKWACALMIYAAAVSGMMVHQILFNFDRIRINMQPAPPESASWLLPLLVVHIVWAVANVIVLAALLQNTRLAPRT